MSEALHLLESVGGIWPHIAGGLLALLVLSVTAHILLDRRDSRSSVAWIGLVWLVPVLGAALYLLFGINRIRRKAGKLAARREESRAPMPEGEADLARDLGPEGAHLANLAHTVRGITGKPLLPGNRVEPLVNGDEAVPAMLEAIGRAERSVTLLSYIFDHDPVGLDFASALANARRRGVEVRVLVDHAGAEYSRPTIFPTLRKADVTAAPFLPTVRALARLAVNLRNHRKILVVDGREGFTGGMNIREGNMLLRNPDHPVRDLHFRVLGPVVAHMQEVFAVDWKFTTGETLAGDLWFPALGPAGNSAARGVPDGPDEDFQAMSWTVLGAVACARESVRIVTPYFLPEADLVAALNVAAMRGVEVSILLPGRSNLPLMQWAMDGDLWQVLGRGCRVWRSPPPFDHSKLIVVDGKWALVGSTNLDPRSLRLNFEFNLEVYDGDLGARLASWFDGRLAASEELVPFSPEPWWRPSQLARTPRRLRNAAARLLKPYL